MMKKLFSKILVIGFLFLSCIPCVQASEEKQTLGELKSLYQQKLKEQEENNNKTEEAKAEIAAKEAAIKKAEGEIHAAEAEEERVQEEIDESNKRIEELTEEVKKILLYLQQMQSQNVYVEYVSGASTVTDMIMRIAAVEQISDYIQTTIDNLQAEIKKNEELKQELIEKQEKLKKQAEEYKKVIEARYKDISEYNQNALDIDEQVKSLKTKLDSAKEKCAKYAPDKGDNAIISEDCVQKVTYGDGTVIVNDGWMKPLTHGIITSVLGSRWGSFHTGLDIGGPSPFEGTPIYAAAAGVVSGKTYHYSCGGNMLFIDVNVGGQAYTTYYYHLLDFNVEVGDVVDQNTILGWVGGYSTSIEHGGYDYCTTGAHLHFGVATGYYNGYSISTSRMIVPPGFPNTKGWSFSSRYQMYNG